MYAYITYSFLFCLRAGSSPEHRSLGLNAAPRRSCPAERWKQGAGLVRGAKNRKRTGGDGWISSFFCFFFVCEYFFCMLFLMPNNSWVGYVFFVSGRFFIPWAFLFEFFLFFKGILREPEWVYPTGPIAAP